MAFVNYNNKTFVDENKATVLIVSKTQMREGVCVGGIVENTCELIRIHNDKGGNLPADAPYEIGDRWEMSVEDAWNQRFAPHVEDKQTSPFNKIENIGVDGIINFIRTHHFGSRLIKGALSDTFEGCLRILGTKNYINHDNIPSFSTQFWIADKDLTYVRKWDKDYYMYGTVRLKFVGYQDNVQTIPAGTIIRLSLANWWDDGSGEERCYLQLSGWYL